METLKLILQAAPTTSDVVGVAKGISDFGMMAIAAAFFIVLAAALMWSCFAWFKGLINGMIEANNKAMADLLAETRAQNAALTDIAEGLRPETKLRIRNLTGFAFDLAIEKVQEVLEPLKARNHKSRRQHHEEGCGYRHHPEVRDTLCHPYHILCSRGDLK